MSKNWTVEQYAAHYAETINSPTNGWGQHISPIFGQSHVIISAAKRRFSSDIVDSVFEKACKDVDAQNASKSII